MDGIRCQFARNQGDREARWTVGPLAGLEYTR